MKKEKQMKMSVKMAALALGVATLSAATILPAAAEDFAIRPGCGGTLIARSGCGSTSGSPNSASVGSPASTAGSAGTAGGGGSLSYDQILAGLGLPPEGVLKGLAELQKDGLYYNYGHEQRGEPTFIGPDGNFIPDGVDPPVHYGGNGWSDKKDENNEAKVVKQSKGRASTVTVNVNANRKAPPTTKVSANAFGSAVNALSHPASQAASASKSATAQKPVAHPQTFGPVGSSSMNARQTALSAGSR